MHIILHSAKAERVNNYNCERTIKSDVVSFNKSSHVS